MASGPITWWPIDGETMETVMNFSWAPKSLQVVTAAMKLKDACSLEKSYDQPREHIEKHRHYFANKGRYSQSYGFSSSHVGMWELDYKESWVLKNWCFWTVVLEKTLESPLDYKEIKQINPKENQSWIIIGRTDAVLKSNTLATWWEKLIHWKRPWGWERLKAGGEGDDRGWDGLLASMTWWTWVWAALRGVGDGQGSLACCSPWGCSQSVITEQLNWKK